MLAGILLGHAGRAQQRLAPAGAAVQHDDVEVGGRVGLNNQRCLEPREAALADADVYLAKPGLTVRRWHDHAPPTALSHPPHATVNATRDAIGGLPQDPVV